MALITRGIFTFSFQKHSSPHLLDSETQGSVERGLANSLSKGTGSKSSFGGHTFSKNLNSALKSRQTSKSCQCHLQSVSI